MTYIDKDSEDYLLCKLNVFTGKEPGWQSTLGIMNDYVELSLTAHSCTEPACIIVWNQLFYMYTDNPTEDSLSEDNVYFENTETRKMSI